MTNWWDVVAAAQAIICLERRKRFLVWIVLSVEVGREIEILINFQWAVITSWGYCILNGSSWAFKAFVTYMGTSIVMCYSMSRRDIFQLLDYCLHPILIRILVYTSFRSVLICPLCVFISLITVYAHLIDFLTQSIDCHVLYLMRCAFGHQLWLHPRCRVLKASNLNIDVHFTSRSTALFRLGLTLLDHWEKTLFASLCLESVCLISKVLIHDLNDITTVVEAWISEPLFGQLLG